MSWLWWLPIVAVVLLALGAASWLMRRKAARATPLAQAKRRFHAQRERLEAKFIQLAAAHANARRPAMDRLHLRRRRGLRAQPNHRRAFGVCGRDDRLGRIATAAAGGTSDAVGNLQAGTAVFRFDRDHWETDGRAILNLSPSEAVQAFPQRSGDR